MRRIQTSDTSDLLIIIVCIVTSEYHTRRKLDFECVTKKTRKNVFLCLKYNNDNNNDKQTMFVRHRTRQIDLVRTLLLLRIRVYYIVGWCWYTCNNTFFFFMFIVALENIVPPCYLTLLKNRYTSYGTSRVREKYE